MCLRGDHSVVGMISKWDGNVRNAMNLIKSCIGLLVMTLLLASCSNQPMTLNNKSEVKQCKMRCMQKFSVCKTQCTDNCRHCRAQSHAEMCKSYANYVREKQIKGEMLDRELKSYRDPLQCRKVTCNCVADLDTCMQGCTGVIQKRLMPLPYCA